MQTIADLQKIQARQGQVEWIGLCTERRGSVEVVSEVEAEAGRGLVGDHHAKKRTSNRQVTLIQAEHLPVVASLLDRNEPVDPALLRRNIVVSGINLLTLKDQRFQVGTAVLEGSGPAPPCSRMEENLGEGGYNAMRGHGGITARVVQAGTIVVGDAVVPVRAPEGAEGPDAR